MIQKVLLPKLGQTMDAGEIARWLKAEGDPVEKGDILLEITTDKATLEVESYVRGVLRKILAQPGQVVPVNGIIALVADADEPLPEIDVEYPMAGEAAPAAVEEAPASAAPAAVRSTAPAVQPLASGRRRVSPRARRAARRRGVPLDGIVGTGPMGRIIERDVLAGADRGTAVKASPVARRAAAVRGVDLGLVSGTGPRGRVTKQDVVGYMPATAAAGAGEAPSTMRRLIAERMAASKREIPHYYLMMDADMTEAVAWRAGLNADADVKVTFNDILLRAAALAARDVPEALALWTDGGIVPLTDVNIGLAVALDEGLIVPVVRNVDRLAVRDVARETAALVQKARTKHLLAEETEGGRLTITNLGMFGIERFLPIIVPGQGAILGVGRIAAKAVVIDGGIAIRQMLGLSLAADHRAADGATGARYLAAVRARLEAPRELG